MEGHRAPADCVLALRWAHVSGSGGWVRIQSLFPFMSNPRVILSHPVLWRSLSTTSEAMVHAVRERTPMRRQVVATCMVVFLSVGVDYPVVAQQPAPSPTIIRRTVL